MKKRGIAVAVVMLALVAAGGAVHPQSRPNPDAEAVRLAALDYVEGVYEVKPDRIRRSVHPTLVKRGFSKRQADGPYVEMHMTFDQLVDLAENWNKEGKRDTSIKKVDVLEVLDQTAVAKVTASWGVDYMLLAKYDGQWKTTLIVWQSPPPRR